MVDIDELTEEQVESLLENPEVRKTIEYDEAGVADVADLLQNLAENEDVEDTYDLFTQSVADRSGRVTQSTVQKVISGMIEEAESVQAEDE